LPAYCASAADSPATSVAPKIVIPALILDRNERRATGDRELLPNTCPSLSKAFFEIV